jgi:hypothetical protein
MLYKLLCIEKTPDRHFHVHHVIIKNKQQRDIAEMNAVHNVLGLITEYACNEFTQSTTLLEYPTFNLRSFNDHDAFTFIAANICLLVPQIDQVAFGLTESDLSDNFSNRREKNTRIWESIYGEMERIYPVSHLTKRDVWELLPHSLRRLTWSCRAPKHDGVMYTPCGMCKPCKAIASFKERSIY